MSKKGKRSNKQQSLNKEWLALLSVFKVTKIAIAFKKKKIKSYS